MSGTGWLARLAQLDIGAGFARSPGTVTNAK